MKYPNLIPIDRAPSWVSSASVRDARSVASRTNTTVWVDEWRHSFVFGHCTNGSIVLFDVLVPTAGAFDGALTGLTVDSVTSAINSARLKPEVKERWRKEIERGRAIEKDRALRQEIDDRKNEANARTRFNYDKASMGKHYKRVVPVS